MRIESKVMMKICYFYDGEYPWDVRVEKICNSLLKKDIEVYIFSRNKFRKERYEFYKGINIIRIPFVKNRFLNDLISTSVFINPIWFINLYILVKKERIDLIIIRDLPISLAGILVSKALKKVCIFDMAEPYPETCKEYLIARSKKQKIINFFLRNPYLATLIENIVLRLADHILVVSKESKDRLLKLRVEEEKISIIGNTPLIEKFHPASPSYPGIMKGLEDKRILIFVGNLLDDRGLILATRAMKGIISQFTDARLLIIGDGPEKKYIKNEVKKLNLEEYVFLAGWIKHDSLPAYIASSDVGILPFMATSHMNITLANKLFDYMAMGKPVIASDVSPMRRIITEEVCGLVFRAENQKSFEEAVIKMLSDSKMMKSMGENGFQAVQKRYNWEEEQEKLYLVINKVLSKKSYPCTNIEL